MRIRKARKEDFEKYSKLKELDFKEYGKMLKTKIPYLEKESKKEFDRILKSKEDFLLFAEDNNNIIGFVHGAITKKPKENLKEIKANIDYLFVKRESRKKGIATKLIKEFFKVAKTKKVKKIFVKCNILNRKIIKFNRKLGFETTNYLMIKKLK